MAQGGDNGLSLASFSPHYVLSGSPMIALMLGFSAFIGFEATAIYSEEARIPIVRFRLRLTHRCW